MHIIMIKFYRSLPHRLPAGSDFVSIVDVPVTFLAGETEQFVEVMLLDDVIFEGEESFTAVLSLQSGSTGVILGPESQATASISDFDST